MPTKSNIRWFKEQFADEIAAAVKGTPLTVDMITAIACEETGYIWSRLRKKGMSVDEILSLCVGDTLDANSKYPRRAFPRTKSALLKKPRGREMFEIARDALVRMAKHVPGYAGAASKPDKFCRGFGLFQRDLQFFKTDPDYFLEKKYTVFAETLNQCLGELRRGLKKLGLKNRKSLSNYEFASVAIAYNTGRFKPNKGLKQGNIVGKTYYGERIYKYLSLAQSVGVTGRSMEDADLHVVIARSGLHVRKGPGTQFGISQTVQAGTEVDVVGYDGADESWARVDLEGDGMIDGYMLASFLGRADPDGLDTENVEEPD